MNSMETTLLEKIKKILDNKEIINSNIVDELAETLNSIPSIIESELLKLGVKINEDNNTNIYVESAQNYKLLQNLISFYEQQIINGKQISKDKLISEFVTKFNTSEENVNKCIWPMFYSGTLKSYAETEIISINVFKGKLTPKDISLISEKYLLNRKRVKSIEKDINKVIRTKKIDSNEHKIPQEFINVDLSWDSLTESDFNYLSKKYIFSKTEIKLILFKKSIMPIILNVKKEMLEILEQEQEVPEYTTERLSEKFNLTSHVIREWTSEQIEDWRNINIRDKIENDIITILDDSEEFTEDDVHEVWQNYLCTKSYIRTVYNSLTGTKKINKLNKAIERKITDDMLGILEKRMELPENCFERLSSKYNLSISTIKNITGRQISDWRYKHIKQQLEAEIEALLNTDGILSSIDKSSLSQKYLCPPRYIEYAG